MGEHNDGPGAGPASRGAGLASSCGIQVWEPHPFSFSLPVYNSFTIYWTTVLDRRLEGWHRVVDLPSAAGGKGDPALGWAALGRGGTGRTQVREAVQRGQNVP